MSTHPHHSTPLISFLALSKTHLPFQLIGLLAACLPKHSTVVQHQGVSVS